MPAGYVPKLLPGQESKSANITTTLTKSEAQKLNEWMATKNKSSRSEAVRSLILIALGLPNDRD